MTTLLAIDTAADICSVAIAQQGSVRHRASSGVRKHAADVLPMIQALLDESGTKLKEIDAIIMVSGPGSFTGLRIGSAVAQGLSFGADIPIIRISSLMILARAAFVASNRQPGTDCFLFTCMHAREDEYYFAVYRDDGLSQPEVLIADQISDAAAILAHLNTHGNFTGESFCVGIGWRQQALRRAEEVIDAPRILSDISGDATTLCDLGRYALAAGQVEPAEQALPVYLKEDMAYRKS
ncbi:MAG: tRNA (adenosine(37)-N6)-threonylcarbamoyltransferase complex dimerization subunit type 1 TsaB [Gammaproteobacteria bacterium]|nr:tRNA (adenosine(37)-N6)-threonylcarbamoyltransferase complex dimerization subunit type 1 TsaB [Gammaproteobacteria bacterium]|tara:strand:+ start:2820 stop:3533 length:714 start_codon:yes stop_codon:yes gene_type:complete